MKVYGRHPAVLVDILALGNGSDGEANVFKFFLRHDVPWIVGDLRSKVRIPFIRETYIHIIRRQTYAADCGQVTGEGSRVAKVPSALFSPVESSLDTHLNGN